MSKSQYGKFLPYRITTPIVRLWKRLNNQRSGRPHRAAPTNIHQPHGRGGPAWPPCACRLEEMFQFTFLTLDIWLLQADLLFMTNRIKVQKCSNPFQNNGNTYCVFILLTYHWPIFIGCGASENSIDRSTVFLWGAYYKVLSGKVWGVL